jgi:hypothetical protein
MDKSKFRSMVSNIRNTADVHSTPEFLAELAVHDKALVTKITAWLAAGDVVVKHITERQER